MFRPAFVQRSDALQLLQHFHRHVIPDALRVAELQIQHRLAQVRVCLAVGQQIAGAAEQFGLFLMLFEPAGHFAVGAAIGQHPNGGPAGAAVWRCVGVDGDQHVGALFARNVGAPHHRDEVVAGTRQHRFELRIGVQHRLQAARNGDGDILFFQPARANGARILAAVASVDRHHHPIAGTGGNAAAARRDFGGGACDDGLFIGKGIRSRRRFAQRRLRRFTHRDRRLTRRWVDRNRRRRLHRCLARHRIGTAFGRNGEHHGMHAAVLAGGDAGFGALGQIKHQAHALSVFRRAGANAFHQVLAAEIERQTADLALLVNVQHHAIRAVQREKRVVRRAIEAHRHRRFTLGVGHFDIGQRRRRQRVQRAEWPQHGDQHDDRKFFQHVRHCGIIPVIHECGLTAGCRKWKSPRSSPLAPRPDSKDAAPDPAPAARRCPVAAIRPGRWRLARSNRECP
ncbi:Uncharacterised protein [Serratia sp. 2880STDY5682894]|nr:Uncharacterised protein [Serratia sp. 2880STDY5682894]